ncbi:MAG: GntR family transcriptional regulator [Beijerinckiaceae bacterium]|nr:GntR family transcriptional regulator [Beijerinckiaceae bacterium]
MAGAKLPKSRQVYISLRERIAHGYYDINGGLPGEQSLAAELGVSRVTLRRALISLEEDGFIERRRGAGTFLNAAGKPAPIPVDLADAMAQLSAMGASTKAQLLAFGYEPATGGVCDALRLSPGSMVQKTIRTRSMDGSPFSYLVAYVPEKIGRTFTKAELTKLALMPLLERAGCVVHKATQDIGAEAATPEAARALLIDVGAPLISLTRTTYDASGAGIEHLRALYRPDRYTFRMELRRAEEESGRRWEPHAPHANIRKALS